VVGIKQKLLKIYDKQYKKLMLVSFIIFFASVGVLVSSYAQTGELFQKGVSLKGGITLTIPVDLPVNTKDLESGLSAAHPAADLSVRELTEGGRTAAIIIEASDVTVEELKVSLPSLGVPLVEGKYSAESMGSALGQQFFSQTVKALVFAFIAMAVVVFITFRSLLPSSFVILAAVSDIVSTLAVVNLLGIKLSTAGIAAFLMLIGYSVDTDILLTTKVLKRKGEGTIFERTLGAMRTGLTMSLTSLAAVSIALIFTQSDTIRQIMIIIFIGLAFDLVYTWFQNAGILRWHLEKKHGN
jgi:preprotein translocase subunit SecF